MQVAIKNIIEQIKFLLLTPEEFWKDQKEKKKGSSTLWLTFMLPLVLTVAVAVFIGEFFSRTDFFIEYPILKALRVLVLYLLTYFVAVYLTAGLMKTFGAKKNPAIARRLVVYSLTPLLLVSILTGLFPFLYVLDVAGFYGLYLFWIGARELLTIPDNKENSYILLTMVANFFVLVLLSILLSKALNAYLS